MIAKGNRKQIMTHIRNTTKNERARQPALCSPSQGHYNAKVDYTDMKTMYQTAHKREDTP